MGTSPRTPPLPAPSCHHSGGAPILAISAGRATSPSLGTPEHMSAPKGTALRYRGPALDPLSTAALDIERRSKAKAEALARVATVARHLDRYRDDCIAEALEQWCDLQHLTIRHTT